MKGNTSIYGLIHNFKKEIGKEIAKTIAEGEEMTARERQIFRHTFRNGKN